MNNVQLTQKQRNKIYRDALNEYKRVKDFGNFYLCNYFSEIFDENWHNLSEMENELPEIVLFRNNDDGLWYSPNNCTFEQSNNIREIALLFCIEMTK